ncbi:MAG: HNH endonuclease [Selenomonadaceae bacterium]|nr:HNH endonuclease [Selenomonadaceae bacterium]
MEKIDFLNCDEFKLIKELMGISDNDKTEFTIVISADDTNLEGTPRGFFYKGRRVILYIRDQAQYGDKIREYKFHLVDCLTLKAMRNQNRYGKYVVSTSTSGKFKVNRIINNRSVEREETLHVCKHCLRRLNQQGYNFTYENFSIEEFFRIMNDDNSGNFSDLPSRNDLTDPLNVYQENWIEISRRLKAKHNYTCQECHRNFSDCKSLLHVHHKNGRKNDNRESNLEVLCYDCHQAKHNHKITRK